jgi:hypothetical protein
MMAFLRLLLLAALGYLVVTVAAFVFLDWWQAVLVSFATFVLLAYAGKLLVRRALARLGRFAVGLVGIKGQVLRGAAVDVHAVRRIAPPADLLPVLDADRDRPPPDPVPRDWYEVEVTLFPAPDAPGPMTHWEPGDLILVPADTPDVVSPADIGRPVDEVGLDRVWLVEDGRAVEPDAGKYHGPQRLRFTAGFPAGIREWKFRYYFEQFGRVRLPTSADAGLLGNR